MNNTVDLSRPPASLIISIPGLMWTAANQLDELDQRLDAALHTIGGAVDGRAVLPAVESPRVELYCIGPNTHQLIAAVLPVLRDAGLPPTTALLATSYSDAHDQRLTTLARADVAPDEVRHAA